MRVIAFFSWFADEIVSAFDKPITYLSDMEKSKELSDNENFLINRDKNKIAAAQNM